MKELRIRMIVLFGATVVMAVLLGAILSVRSAEKEYREELNSYNKMYSSYYVGPDGARTVWDMYDAICEMYPDTSNYTRNDWIDEVRHMNHLDGACSITYGNYVLFPYLNGQKEVAE